MHGSAGGSPRNSRQRLTVACGSRTSSAWVSVSVRPAAIPVATASHTDTDSTQRSNASRSATRARSRAGTWVPPVAAGEPNGGSASARTALRTSRTM